LLGVTHSRIARTIAKEFQLSSRYTKLFEKGSEEPDNWGDWPHHRGKESEIVVRILSSRKKVLERDNECFYDLGIASHYIQDAWTRARIKI
jgi:hypothetical protein